MHDVVIIGGGNAGMAIGGAWEKAGLKVAIVEECCDKPDWWDSDWVHARGTVAGRGLVAALDPDTSDERRLLQCKAIVIAVSRMDTDSHTSRMLGITKLGAELSEDKTQVITDENGRTRAAGIFAAGSCATSVTPNIIQEVMDYCSMTPAVKEAGVE